MASAIDQLAALAPTAEIDAPLWVALAAALREIAGREIEDAPVLSTEQAVKVANFKSPMALYRWAKTWRVTPVGHNRWSRRAIQMGLQREACNVLYKRAGKTPSKPASPIS